MKDQISKALERYKILRKSVEKAKKNGFKIRDLNEVLYDISYNDIIFSHDFAKAFWGEESVNEIGNPCDHLDETEDSCWRYHLQKMVVEENPLKYLEKFLNE